MTDRLETWERWPVAALFIASGLYIAEWYAGERLALPPWLVDWISTAGGLFAMVAVDGAMIATVAGMRSGRRGLWSYAAILVTALFGAGVALVLHGALPALIGAWLHAGFVATIATYLLHLAQPRQAIATSAADPEEDEVSLSGESQEELVALPARATDGFVYVLRSDAGYYKIGRARDVAARIKGIAVFVPFAITTIHVIKTDNMFKLERGFHRAYDQAGKRIRGEWYALTEDDIDLLRSFGDELAGDSADTAIEVAGLLAGYSDPALIDDADPLAEKKRLAAILRAEHKSWREIAETVGRAPSTVREWLVVTASNGNGESAK